MYTTYFEAVSNTRVAEEISNANRTEMLKKIAKGYAGRVIARFCSCHDEKKVIYRKVGAFSSISSFIRGGQWVTLILVLV